MSLLLWLSLNLSSCYCLFFFNCTTHPSFFVFVVFFCLLLNYLGILLFHCIFCWGISFNTLCFSGCYRVYVIHLSLIKVYSSDIWSPHIWYKGFQKYNLILSSQLCTTVVIYFISTCYKSLTTLFFVLNS